MLAGILPVARKANWMAAISLAARSAAQSLPADDLPSWDLIKQAVAQSPELEWVEPAELGDRWTLVEGGDS